MTPMTAQKGKDLLLKIDDGSGYVTVAGLRARRLAFNAAAVDVTDAESAGRWRELLAGAGVQRASLSGGGLFKDATSDALVRQVFFSSEIRSWQVIIPDFGTVTGPFQIVALEYAGRHDGEVTFEIALESAGELIFGAA
jgi:TP901-1 family phage major tail protein